MSCWLLNGYNSAGMGKLRMVIKTNGNNGPEEMVKLRSNLARCGAEHHIRTTNEVSGPEEI